VPGDAARTDQLKQAYTRAIWEAGGVPLLLPNLPYGVAQAYLDRLDGLLLAGGRDIEPSRYGDPETHPTVELDQPRDQFELPLVRAAHRRDMPILGVCRGIQVLNVALGGTLWQDLPGQSPTSVEHRQTARGDEATHNLRVTPRSRLARVLSREEMRVNSFHHQAVRVVAKDLLAVGWSEDGIIEAVEDPRKPFAIGVQYHPEEMVDVCSASARLFARFVAASAGQYCKPA
jgi:putative glutamine amidotransferase